MRLLLFLSGCTYNDELPKNRIAGSPDTLPIEVDGTYCENYSIEFLDLNGDGRLEIITAQEGHNLYLAVYDIVDSNAVEALSLYFGD